MRKEWAGETHRVDTYSELPEGACWLYAGTDLGLVLSRKLHKSPHLIALLRPELKISLYPSQAAATHMGGR